MTNTEIALYDFAEAVEFAAIALRNRLTANRTTIAAKPKVTDRERVLKFIARFDAEGGVSKREIMAGCRTFRNLSQSEKESMLEQLVNIGAITKSSSTTGRGIVYSIQD